MYRDVKCIPQVEALEMVERGFVHVDYERRDMEEHKVGEREGKGVGVEGSEEGEGRWRSD
jgi:hypothetical protein